MSVLGRRIRPEPWVECGPERAQCGSTRAEAIGNETPLELACRGNRFGKFLRLQCRQITLQHNDIRDRFGHHAFGGCDGVVQRVQVAVRGG
jgi:hypothetical protein